MWEGSNDVVEQVVIGDQPINYKDGLEIDIDDENSVSLYGKIIFDKVKEINEMVKVEVQLDSIEIDQSKIDRYRELTKLLKSGFGKIDEKNKQKGILAIFKPKKETVIQSRKKTLEEYESLLDYIESISKKQLENAEKEKDRITKIYSLGYDLLEAFDMYIENGNNVYNYYLSNEPEKLEDRKANLDALFDRISFLQSTREAIVSLMVGIEQEQKTRKSAVIKFRNKYDKLTITRLTLTLDHLFINLSEQIEVMTTIEESYEAAIVCAYEQVAENRAKTNAMHIQPMLGVKAMAAIAAQSALTEEVAPDSGLTDFSEDLSEEFDVLAGKTNSKR